MSDQNNEVSSNAAATEKTFRVGIIGTGRPRGTKDATGFGMSGAHADGYNALPNCKIVALCDLVRDRAEEFNREKADGKAAVYTDYHQMLADARLDIVSICTWPALHASMVLAAANAGVRAIHCEKPIAPTWGECRRMVNTCQQKGVQLTFNHQRRFLDVFQRARQLVQEGAIGELKQLEGACGDLLDWGTHWLDMFGMYNEEAAPKWVMGQLDCRAPKSIFGVPAETQAVTYFEYENGVLGQLFTGEHANEFAGCANRLVGTQGTIEVLWNTPALRMRRHDDADWTVIEEGIEGGIHDNYANLRSVAEVVAALAEGRKPLIDAANALNSTAIIFGTYESARRRGRIDMPLQFEDSPLKAMLDAGVFPQAIPDDALAA